MNEATGEVKEEEEVEREEGGKFKCKEEDFHKGQKERDTVSEQKEKGEEGGKDN